ncbi:hypothetical protein GCM10023085_10470 [Actinomadura viridis]
MKDPEGAEIVEGAGDVEDVEPPPVSYAQHRRTGVPNALLRRAGVPDVRAPDGMATDARAVRAWPSRGAWGQVEVWRQAEGRATAPANALGEAPANVSANVSANEGPQGGARVLPDRPPPPAGRGRGHPARSPTTAR